MTAVGRFCCRCRGEPLVAARSGQGGDAPVPAPATPHEHAAPNAIFT
jgi:hypothetical protein